MSSTNDDEPQNGARHEGLGRTMLFWLGRELRLARQDAGDVKLVSITTLLHANGKPVSQSRLSRFETAKNYPQGTELDAIVAAYARACGLGDGRIIWKRALAKWLKVPGAAPVIGELTPQMRAMLLAEGAEGQARARRAAAAEPRQAKSRPARGSLSDAGGSPSAPNTKARRSRAQ